MQPNVADARGLAFACQPGCGFCCTASPLVLAPEAPRLGALVQRAEDGALRIPISGPACGALGADRRCTVYEARPSVCHLYPYQTHAGRRLQVTVSLACPGVMEMPPPEPSTEGSAAHPFGVDRHADEGARRAAELALAQPGASEMAAQAKATFAEYDRRMKEWKVEALPDKLRAAFLPHAARLARPEALPALFAGISEGDLVLDRKGAVAALFDAEPEAELHELLAQTAEDAFDTDDVLWVEPPSYAWTMPRAKDGRVALRRVGGPSFETRVDDLPIDWDESAAAVLEAYLARLAHRDHTEGAAAWLVDASGYQATPAAAYARVLGEAALQVVLRAGLLAAERGVATLGADDAWRGVRAYETSYHSLPTLGAVL